MALKDWEQRVDDYVSSNELIWDNLKNKEGTVSIWMPPKSSFQYNLGIALTIHNGKRYIESQKWFKTKSQALSFAKNYMRTH